MPNKPLLIGDIGGTNARFALADFSGDGYSSQRTLKCADFATADAAISCYLEDVSCAAPGTVCLAAAGAIVDQRVRFTNNPWTIDAHELRRRFRTERVRLLNDFEAVAYAIPVLAAKDTLPVGLPAPMHFEGEHLMAGAIGPGTGLGTVGLKKINEHFYALPSEAAHAGFAPETRQQGELLSLLRERFERVSRERLVSGPGLENLYWALCRLHAEQPASLTAAEIFAAASRGADERANDAVELFFELLGQVAGDLALTLGASAGIYISGGIVRRYPQRLVDSRFRAGFENKGRHRALMERIPTRLITHEQPGLLGAAYCAANLLPS